MLKIVILPHAETILIETAMWYKTNLGNKGREQFVKGILSAIRMLATFPGLGRIMTNQSTDDVVVRSYTEHRNHQIIYYCDNDTLFVADIWSTRTKH
ncbi:MAG: type II toxin-antitoxin system RelE/ParE family toxin [Bacteroidaceae bacterium]|nr:type II toxin-antitoxin system RelE/ParE family toxin [Bacteroidaceae bacterium]